MQLLLELVVVLGELLHSNLLLMIVELDLLISMKKVWNQLPISLKFTQEDTNEIRPQPALRALRHELMPALLNLIQIKKQVPNLNVTNKTAGASPSL